MAGFFRPEDTRGGLQPTYTTPGTFRPPSSPSGLPATFTPGRVVNPTPAEVNQHLLDIYAPPGAIPTTPHPNVPGELTGKPFPTAAENAAAAKAAADKQAATTPTTPTSTDYNHRLPNETTAQWVVRWANGNNRPDIAADPSYWVSAIDSKPHSDDMGYWVGRLQTPDTGGSGDSAGGFGAFTAPFTGTYVPPVTNFTAPVGTDDPGFKFAVEQGQDAIQRSAAAKGNLLTGGTLKDLASYTTGAALQDYAGSYNRALNTAGFNNNTAFQAFGQNYDIFRNNQNDPFQKLYATTGLGLNAAGASNSALGNYAGNLGSLGSTYGGDIASLTTGQGNARATGTQVGSAQGQQWYRSLSDWLQSHPFSG